MKLAILFCNNYLLILRSSWIQVTIKKCLPALLQEELAYKSPLITPVMPRKGSGDRRKGCDELQMCPHCPRKFGSKVISSKM